MIKHYNGKIEIITGPMFSGKSDELIKRVKRYGHAHIKTLVIKPLVDKRWSKEKIISRSGASISVVPAKYAKDILEAWDETYEVVAIDEGQFFDEKLISVAEELARRNVRVIISALDQDFEGKPFTYIPKLLAVAEKVDKLTAVCMKCGASAHMSYRKSISKNTIEIGDDEYEARCRECHAEGLIEKTFEFSIEHVK